MKSTLSSFLVSDPNSSPIHVQKEFKVASKQHPSVMLGRCSYYGYFVLTFNRAGDISIFYVEKNAGHVYKFVNELALEKPNMVIEKKVARHDKGAKDKDGNSLIYPRLYLDGDPLLHLGFDIGEDVEVTYNFPNRTITIRPKGNV